MRQHQPLDTILKKTEIDDNRKPIKPPEQTTNIPIIIACCQISMLLTINSA